MRVSSMARKALNILVVEDEQHLAHGIKYNLEAEGYRAITAEDGRIALAILEDPNESIDLVILDLMLPGMSGYAVCDSLRASGNNVPVLMLSARTLTEDRTRGFDVGANQYMSKPFELDELLSRVKNLLTFSQQNQQDSQASETRRKMIISFGSADIDFETFQVTVRGTPVRLTQLEMKLLEYFVDNHERVISRDELLEKVWGIPSSINTRAPDQFIRRLRKIFENDPANPQHFLTIRDAGYRFVAEQDKE